MMKIFKVILILVLLFSISVFANYNQPLTQGEISDWQKSYGRIGDATSVTGMTTETNKTYVSWVDDEPDTLLEWFKSLTLDEKIDVYNWWKNESVDYDIELFIRLDKD